MRRMLIAVGLAIVLGRKGAMAQGRIGTEASAAVELGSLASLESLKTLGSLKSLASLQTLQTPQTLRSLSSLWSLASLAELGALGVEGVEMNGVFIVPRPSFLLPQSAGPADSLYRAARRALSDGDYERAAELFERVREKFPKSAYAADSYYWQAFSLYKTGNDPEYRAALAALDNQAKKHPQAATRKSGEAATLATRIRGAMARGGDSEAAETVTRDATRSAAGCPDEDNDERVEALNALLQMDSDRALPIIMKVLGRRDACSAPLRRKAVFLLSQKRGADVADALLSVAKNDPDAETREQAVFWLSQVSTERAVDMLQQILAESKDDGIREKALFALSQHRSERAEGILQGYAKDERAPDELREKAIFWLGQKHGGNAEFLRSLYATLKSDELKEKVLFSLSQMRGRGNDQWLIDRAMDGKEADELRKKALFWAGQGGASMTQLIGLYDKLTEQEMKEQLIFVYSQRREKEAFDKMLSIARTEKNTELRKKAIFWISQSQDPRAAQLLEEIINQ